jgi:hypothetical protein
MSLPAYGKAEGRLHADIACNIAEFVSFANIIFETHDVCLR